MKIKLLKKFLSFSVGTWIGAVLGIITIPLMTHWFTPEEFGKASMFNLALNILSMFILFGIDEAFVRFYYEEKSQQLLSKCLFLTFIVYSFVISLIIVFRKEISIYLFDQYIPSIIFLLIIGLVMFIVNRYAQLILRMEQKGVLFSVLQVIPRFVELLFLLILVLVINNSYSIIIYAKVISFFFVAIFIVYRMKGTITKLESPFNSSTYSLKDILKYSYPLALTGLIGWLLQTVDRLAIKEWSTYTELGLYTSAFRIVLILQMIQTSFTTYWAPLSLDKFLNNNNTDENLIFFRKMNITITVVMFIFGIGLIASKDLIIFFLGEKYKGSSAMIPFLVFMPIMYTITETTQMGLSFYKKVRTTLVTSVLVCVFNILGNFILVPKYGGVGASVSTGLSYVFYYILRTGFAKKYYNIKIDSVRFYFMLLVLIAYATYSTFYSWDVSNLFAGILLVCSVIAIYYKHIKAELVSAFS